MVGHLPLWENGALHFSQFSSFDTDCGETKENFLKLKRTTRQAYIGKKLIASVKSAENNDTFAGRKVNWVFRKKSRC